MKIADHIRVVHDGERTFHLLGTAHVSQRSVDEVREMIAELQPDTVCVELCQPRYEALTDETRWRKLNIFQVIREGRTLFLLANLAVGAYQRRLGAELGVKPGAELLAAVEAAEQSGATVQLIDRKIDITLKRAWASLGFFKKAMMLSAIVESLISREEIGAEKIESLKEGHNLSEMVDQLATSLPEVKTSLIDERDQYMSTRILRAPGNTVLAVVGAAHLKGIEGLWGTESDLVALDTPPPPTLMSKIGPWLIPALLVIAVAWGFVVRDPEDVARSFMGWAITTSVFATLGTIAAGGKFLTVLSAFVAAPFTAIHPIINAGMVTGIVEAWLRKPTVEDAERIPDDVQSLRGLYKNPFTRVLLVVVGSIFGTAIGSWIGMTWVLRLFGSDAGA